MINKIRIFTNTGRKNPQQYTLGGALLDRVIKGDFEAQKDIVGNINAADIQPIAKVDFNHLTSTQRSNLHHLFTYQDITYWGFNTCLKK